MMNFISRDALWIKLEANLVEDDLDELLLSCDNFENVICRSYRLLQRFVANDDCSDVSIVRATIREEVFVVAL